jgi:hypothetical protein
LKVSAYHDPWQIFTFAAKVNDVDLARVAIRAFDRPIRGGVFDLKDYIANEIPTVDNGYVEELVRQRAGGDFMLRQLTRRLREVEGVALVPWERVSEEFFYRCGVGEDEAEGSEEESNCEYDDDVEDEEQPVVSGPRKLSDTDFGDLLPVPTASYGCLTTYSVCREPRVRWTRVMLDWNL